MTATELIEILKVHKPGAEVRLYSSDFNTDLEITEVEDLGDEVILIS